MTWGYIGVFNTFELWHEIALFMPVVSVELIHDEASSYSAPGCVVKYSHTDIKIRFEHLNDTTAVCGIRTNVETRCS